MPVLIGRAHAQGEAADGCPVAVPRGQALAEAGPRLQVTLGIALSIAEELQAAGTPVPEPVSGFALIDTGASETCIDAQVARRMKLPVVGTCTLATPSHEAIEKNRHPVHIQVVGRNIAFAVPAAIGADLMGLGILALLGRDVLFQCILVYSGPDDSYSLSL